MTEYSKPIRLQIDTTMMGDTEIRIVESHIEAIRRVVEGAQPQPAPAQVPEWRRMVNEYASEDPGESRAVLSYVLSLLSEIAAGENWQKPYGELAQIIAHCEAQVGDGWQAEPDRYTDLQREAGLVLPPLQQIGVLILSGHWGHGADGAALWLRDLTEGGSE